MKHKIIVKYNFNPKTSLATKIDLDNKIMKEFNLVGKTMEKKVIQSMNTLKSGALNSRTGKPRSKKGEGLANDKGDTSKSIGYNLGGSKWLDFGGDTKQLAIWEGDSNSKYNNRPTLLKYVKQYSPILQQRFKNMLKKIVK